MKIKTKRKFQIELIDQKHMRPLEVEADYVNYYDKHVIFMNRSFLKHDKMVFAVKQGSWETIRCLT